jgi:hypothetical protein
MIVSFSSVTVSINRRDKLAVAVHRVDNGCCIGFLKKFMVCHRSIFEGVQALVIRVLVDDASSTPEVSDQAFHHHNHGSAKVVCITPKNKPAPKECKRPVF